MDGAQQFLPLLGQDDPLSAATAALEARRRQQVTDAGYPGAAADAGNPYQSLVSMLGPSLVERAIAQRDAMRSGNWRPDPMLAMDMAAMAGTTRGPIRAYHGSPHDFDKFSMDKIGTGEGAQAYGHGLYFAENEGVARSYRDALTRERGATVWRDAAGREVDIYGLSRAADGGDPRALAATFLQQEKNVDDALNFARRLGADAFSGGDPARRAILEGLEQFKASGLKREPAGRMYEVNIHADPERFLDWDAPLSTQPKPVQDIGKPAIERALADGMMAGSPATPMTGADVYETLRMYTPEWAAGGMGKADAASMLRDAGIPGIKYLDQGSRVAGDGSRNYVVFSDQIVEILRKYGLLPPLAAGGAAALPGEAEAAP